MVFVNTKAFVERVARALERAGYRVGVLSGDVPQKKRESLLKKFQAGQLELLVATDVAARGLHIDGVSHVYNYDLPFDAEDYVHRIGRTARLGAEGDAISFACERYAMSLPDIEAYIEQKIPSEPVTRELMTALPRPERERPAVVEGEDGDSDDSLSTIFREAREARAADDAKRGGGRSGGGGRSSSGGPGGRGRSGERSGPRSGGSAGGGERRERTPRPPRDPAAQTPATVPDAIPAVAATVAEGERSQRKRRRRRGGKRIDGGTEGAAANPVTQAVRALETPAPVAVKPAGEGKPSLFSRIGNKLKSLVTKPPRSQH
jgi:ATP-dependent RNA helicase RhlB